MSFGFVKYFAVAFVSAVCSMAGAKDLLVTSNHPLAMLAAEIAPADLAVKAIADKNHSLHHQGLRPSQLLALADAGLVLWFGAVAEPGFERAIGRLDAQLVAEVGSFEGEGNASGGSHEHGADIHIWLNPASAVQLADKVREVITAKWPQYENEVSANFSIFRSKMTLISPKNSLKEQKVQYLALHDAYNHLAEFYNLQLIGAVLDSAGGKPGARHLWSLERDLSGLGSICAIGQPQFDSRYFDVLSASTSLKIIEIDPVAAAYTAAKGEFVRFSQDNYLALQICSSR